MSPLLRPVGPLAPRVYWVRRALVLGGLALVLLLGFGLVKLLGFSGGPDSLGAVSAQDSEPTAEPSPASTVRSPEDEGGVGGGSGTSGSTDGDDGAGAAAGAEVRPEGAGEAAGGGQANGEQAGGEQPEGGQEQASEGDGATDAEPAGSADPDSLPLCRTDALTVSAEPATRQAPAGSDLKLTVRLVNEDDSSCRVEVNPTTLQVHVLSGSEVIWVSAHCPVHIPTGPLTLTPDTPRPLSVEWPGTRSAPECAEDQPEARPGTYQTRATLGQLVSAPQRFELT